jgi:hypothetical protein
MISHTGSQADPLTELCAFSGQEWSESQLVKSSRGKKKERSFEDIFSRF